MAIATFTTPRGVFSVDPVSDAKMAAALRRGEPHGDETLELFSALVGKESVVLDIGAHIGTLAVPLARMVRTVVAFEPVPSSFRLLVQNAAQNGVRIDARNKGLALRAGRASATVMNPGNAGANTMAPGEGELALSTLDEEAERADLIKIDVEGMELEVLRGGERLIAAAAPLVFFEVNLFQMRAHKASLRALQAFFRKRGYRLFIPIKTKRGLGLGRVANLTLLTALIAPRALFFRGPSAPFDILAAPAGKSLPLRELSAARTLGLLMLRYLRAKARQWGL